MTGAVDDQLGDALSLAIVRPARLVARQQRLLQRLKVRVHVLDSGLRAQRGLHSLGSLVSVGQRGTRLHLEVQRHALAARVLVDGDVMHVAYQWLGESVSL